VVGNMPKREQPWCRRRGVGGIILVRLQCMAGGTREGICHVVSSPMDLELIFISSQDQTASCSFSDAVCCVFRWKYALPFTTMC
jgi:hypothetical protein